VLPWRDEDTLRSIRTIGSDLASFNVARSGRTLPCRVSAREGNLAEIKQRKRRPFGFAFDCRVNDRSASSGFPGLEFRQTAIVKKRRIRFKLLPGRGWSRAVAALDQISPPTHTLCHASTVWRIFLAALRCRSQAFWRSSVRIRILLQIELRKTRQLPASECRESLLAICFASLAASA